MKMVSPGSRMLFSVLLLFWAFTGTAQFTQLAVSKPFEEPTKGFGKILLLKNGNTICLTLHGSALKVRLYNSSHQLSAETEPAFQSLENGTGYIKSVFEVNNDVVLLVMWTKSRKAKLARIVIDGGNGRGKGETELAVVDEDAVKWVAGQASADRSAFGVRKDPFSDYYAILLRGKKKEDISRQMECLWFNGKHEQIGRAYLPAPAWEADWYESIDMAVMGDRQVVIVANAAPSGRKGKKQLVMASFSGKDKKISVTPLPINEEYTAEEGMVKYNPVTQKLILLANMSRRGEKGFLPVISYVDPETRKIDFTGLAIPETAIEASTKLFGRKRGFNGLPQDLYIVPDGSFTVILEETFIEGNSTGYSVYLGDIAVIYFDLLGAAKSSYFIPKMHKLLTVDIDQFYMGRKSLEPVQFLVGSQYKRAAYIDARNASFVLLNDIEKNGELARKGKLTTIYGVSDCDGFAFAIGGSETVPDRKPVFNTAADRNHHFLGVFGMSDYDPTTNTLVTLRLERDGRSKEVQLVWIRP